MVCPVGAYPNELLNKLARIILDGMIKAKFNILNLASYSKMQKDSICMILNESWKMFWNDSTNYRKFEENFIENMRKLAN